MLLSFYDSYWNDDFIPEEYDQVSYVNSSQQALGLSSNVESPGVKNAAIEDVLNLSESEYEAYISSSLEYDFQSFLIDYSDRLFGDDYAQDTDSPYGLNFYQQTTLLYRYLVFDRSITTNVFTMDNVRASDYPSQEKFLDFIRGKIESGIPVLINTQSLIFGSHTMIAYDCDDYNIYVHTGWKSSDDSAYTHVCLDDLGIISIDSAASFEMVNEFLNPCNYVDKVTNEKIGVICFSYPHDIQVPSEVFLDTPPSFSWKSLYDEKWFNTPALFKIQFSLNDVKYPRDGSFLSTRTTSLTLSKEQWNEMLQGSSSPNAKIFITCFKNENTTYTSSCTFPCLVLNQTFYRFNSADFGFQDSYPTSAETSNTFIKHQKDDFAFMTRRYRTGYIQNECIVLSPKRMGITESYLEFQFYKGITRIDVDMSFWSEQAFEGLNSNTGKLKIEYFENRTYHSVMDFFKENIKLPETRNNKKTITVTFNHPVFRVRFYASMNQSSSNENDRGRVCLDNFIFFETQENILPLNGYELEYDINLWDSSHIRTSHTCYTYALNFLPIVWGETGLISCSNPGEFTSDDYDELMNTKNEEGLSLYFSPQIIESMVLSDSEAGIFNDSNFVFKPIGKYEVCDDGCYKVALVFDLSISNPDYHWYRQDSNGMWSHKLGSDSVCDFDGNRKKIYDPETCCHEYDGFNYNSKYGVTFYQVSPVYIYE